MKRHLFNSIIALALFLLPGASFGQAIINLGTAANFVLFTGVGAVTNTGITHLTGNVGSNSGSSTGFGNVDGQMHSGDGVTGTCAADLLIAYGQLNTAVPTFFPAPLLGNGAILAEGVYSVSAAATLNGDLSLDAAGDPNATFIFQIAGPLSVNALAKVKLINGAKACNVYWKVEGLVSISNDVVMRGTIVANNAAINMSTNDTLEGRALCTIGAIGTTGILAYTPIGCSAPILTGPAASSLVSTAAYGLFSSDGPVSNTGITHIIGDVGTNLGLTTGFNPLFVTGTIHPIPDGSTAACAADLLNVYNYLNTLPYDIELLYPAQFGNDLVLTPHTYLMNSAVTFTGNVYLNAEGNSNAVFVIQVNGAVITSTLSHVILINGAQAKNVYWSVNGAVHIYDNSVFNGTLIANNGAIDLNSGDTLNGRALSTTGAVTSNGIFIGITDTGAAPCVAPHIMGLTHICEIDTTTLSDSTSGGKWLSSNITVATIDSTTGFVTGLLAGNTIITYTLPTGCRDTMLFTVGAATRPIIGLSQVCIGSTITLTDLDTGGIWSSRDTLIATVDTGLVNGIAAGNTIISYTLPSGCSATKDINVAPSAGVITGPSSVCVGSSITLMDTTSGGVWSAVNVDASVLNGVVTGLVAGVDTIEYSVTNVCGTAIARKTVTVTGIPNAGVIAGASTVCTGSSITLTDAQPGGIWSASNAHALVAAGVVSGISAGLDTISYRVTNLCGADTATKTITVNPLPDAGVISGASAVCVGSSITLTDAQPGGFWSATNTSATVVAGVVTGVASGIDTIHYIVFTICGNDTATRIVTINPLPNAGVIAGSSGVCVGSSTTLTDAQPGGTWASSNGTATVLGGLVTGVIAGIDTITYWVTNVCGNDTASKIITINPLPDAGVILGLSGVCVLSSITLTDAQPGGIWSASNANATILTGVVTGVFAGLDTISYIATTICGADTATKVITINPLPNAGSISGLSAVCIGSSITLSDPALSGTWTISNGTATISGTVVTGVSAGLDTVSYSVTNSCGTDIAVKTITVNPNPAAPVISLTSTATVCDSTYFHNFGAATLAPAGTYYTWSTLNAMVSDTGSTGQYALINFKTVGTATVFLTTAVLSTGCSTTTGHNVTVTSEVADVPARVIYFNHSFVCLQNNEEGYEWGYDDAATLAPTIVAGELNQDYDNANPDFNTKNYWVRVSHNGCSQKAYCNKPTGAQMKMGTTTVTVYPSPASSQIQVEINTNFVGRIQLEVLNMVGQKLNTTEVTGNITQINVEQYLPGVYMVNCYQDGIKVSTTRFIKN